MLAGLTMADLGKAVVDRNLEELLSELLFERVPFVFDNSWADYRTWRLFLASAIKVDPSEIIIVGTAAVGHSLAPAKGLKPFDAYSDVDVAIVSHYFFSEAWHHLRSIDLTLTPLTPPQKAAVIEHQKRYIYWGCVATDRLLPLLPFATAWLEARAALTARAPTVDREINFRIYRDFRALRAYQLRGLQRLRDALLDPQGELGADVS
jgi:hypothetical protein